MNQAFGDILYSAKSHASEYQRAIIFEGGGGVGTAAGVSLARLGAEIGLIGANSEQLNKVAFRLKEAGARAVATSVFDTSLVSSLDTALPHLIGELEGLDTMIWVIAVDKTPDEASIKSCNLIEWDKTVDSQFRALVHAAHHCLDALTTSTSGMIVIVDESEKQIPGCSTTLGISHAVQHFADSLFEDIAKYGVKVTFIKSGLVAMPPGVNRENRPDRSRMIQFEDMTGLFDYLLSSPRSACPTEITLQPFRSTAAFSRP